MYIYQNGKLYMRIDEKLVGVDIYFDKVLIKKDCVAELSDNYDILTKSEVQKKFHIDTDPYIFPVVIEKKEVKVNDTVGEIKKPNTTKRVKK